MLRSIAKISRSSIKINGRGFSSKPPGKDLWNEPINELKSTTFSEESTSKTILPGGSINPSKVVAVTGSKAGISFSNFKETPCAEKKFSPCAERKKPKTPFEKKKPAPCSDSKNDSSDCFHHKDLVPPSCELELLKSFELKSNCTTFHLKTEN